MKQWKQVAILGVGLLGGSIGLGLRKRGLAGTVVGIGRNRERLELALQRGAVDSVTVDIAEGTSTADLVVVCTPVEHIVDQVRQVAASCPETALITDVGSTKAQIVEQLHDLRGARFVGSHPMAGSEKTGVGAARDDLFADRPIVVISDATDADGQDAVDTVVNFWRSLQGNVLRMTATEHDRAVAAVSHMPHVISTALAECTPMELLQLASTGWGGMTRVAEGDPELWRQILAQNRDNVLGAIDLFIDTLRELRDALEQDDMERLVGHLEAGQQTVRHWEESRDTLGS